MESVTACFAFLKWGGHTQEDCVVIRKGFADQHGFKLGDRLHFSKHENGVVSLLLPDNEMPCSEEGTIPDILVANHDRFYWFRTLWVLKLLQGKVIHQGGPLMDDLQIMDLGGCEIFKQGSMRIRTVVGYGPVTLIEESSSKVSTAEGEALLQSLSLID